MYKLGVQNILTPTTPDCAIKMRFVHISDTITGADIICKIYKTAATIPYALYNSVFSRCSTRCASCWCLGSRSLGLTRRPSLSIVLLGWLSKCITESSITWDLRPRMEYVRWVLFSISSHFFVCIWFNLIVDNYCCENYKKIIKMSQCYSDSYWFEEGDYPSAYFFFKLSNVFNPSNSQMNEQCNLIWRTYLVTSTKLYTRYDN